jgi:hypothetical protein
MKLKSEKRNWEGLLFLASSKRYWYNGQKGVSLRRPQKKPKKTTNLTRPSPGDATIDAPPCHFNGPVFDCFLRKTLVKFRYTLQFDYFLTVVVFKGNVSHETFFFH